MAAQPEPVSLPELVTLLYRADVTGLSLAATVHDRRDLTLHQQLSERAVRRRPRLPAPAPPKLGVAEHTTRVLIAPGGRYRSETVGADEPHLAVCDGESRWEVLDGVAWRQPVGGTVEPAPALLAPAEVLTRFDLDLVGTSRVGGRDAHRVLATARPGGGGFWAERDRLLDHVLILVDAEFGILLRYEEVFDGRQLTLTELSDLVVNPPEAADPARFRPPAGVPVRESERVFTEGVTLPGPPGAAVRSAAGLVGSALGFAARHAGQPGDPTPDPEPMPQAAQPSSGHWQPADDDLVTLLHRTGLAPLSVSAVAHEWLAGRVALAAVAGFRDRLPGALDGIFGPDAVWDAVGDRAPELVHRTDRLRVAMPGRYRIDHLTGERPRRPRTIACDGEQLWKVRPDRIGNGPAEPLPQPYRHLLDLAWLLNGYELRSGGDIELHGRPGLLVSAVPDLARRPSSRGGPAWASLGRVELVVDARLGIALRQTWFHHDQPAVCYELREVVTRPPDPAEFRVDVPPGTPVTGTGPRDELGLSSPAAAAKAAAGLAFAGMAALSGWLQKRPATPPRADGNAAGNEPSGGV